MMMRFAVIMLLLLLALCCLSEAPIDKKTAKFQVRKSFVGTKEEKEPASFFWFERTEDASNEFFKVDIAVKITEWYLIDKDGKALSLYPVIEWHRSTDSATPKNTLSGTAKSEYFTGTGRNHYDWNLSGAYKIAGDRIKGTDSHVTTFLLRPYRKFVSIDDKGEQVRDERGNLVVHWTPGNEIRPLEDPDFMFRYYPYIGYERYSPVSDTVAGDAEFALARIYLESQIPFADQFLQALVTYTYRDKLGGNATVEDHPEDVSFQLNYLIAKGVSIGYSYDVGDDPEDGFVNRRQHSLGFKVKIN